MAPGAIWDPITNFPGLRPFKIGGGASKIVLHTTETAVKPNWEQQQSGIPHITVDLREGETWQHLPFDTAAYTLEGGNYDSPNSDCGDPTIQVEIVGYAADSPRWSDREYERLASLLRWLCDTLRIPFAFPLSFAAVASRPSIAEFKTLAGIVGHEHVHGEDHTDPGALDVSRLDPTVGPDECDCDAILARLDAVEARLDVLEGSPEPPTPPDPPEPPPAPDAHPLPPSDDFSPGVKHDSFTWMGERFLVWLSKSEIASAAGSYTPGPTYSTYDDENVRMCQAKMGDTPDPAGKAFFGQKQWDRLENDPPRQSSLTTKVATYNSPHRLDPVKLAPDMQKLADLGNTVIGTQENTDSDPKVLCPDGWKYFRPEAAMSASIFWDPQVWEKIDQGFVKVSSSGWDSVRGIVWVDLTSKKSGKVWRFGSLHLVAFKTSKPPNAEEYRKQVQKAADWLDGGANRVILCDCNGTPGGDWMRPMDKVGTPHTPTQDTGPDGAKGIDQVWVNDAHARAKDAKAMSGRSDHKALYATLTDL
jgi:hypothetical protein